MRTDYIALIAFMGLNIVAFYHVFVAMRKTRPDITDARARFVLLGTLAKRELFTEDGWRHRNLAILFNVLSFVVGGLVLVLGS